MADKDTSNMSEEELEAYYTSKRKEYANIRVETAIMLDSGIIMYGEKGHLDDGQPVASNLDIKPEDANYKETCKTFNLNKPGDSYMKQYKWVDGEWILESEGTFK